ncbi:MAG TPA: hypothetical protein VHL98_07840 [Microvirga sp.]|jgi:hypothetical protein|nr:hypothetical protein [Microvirga sp.]
MSNAAESVGSLGMKGAMTMLDEHMRSRGVSEETRSAVINTVEMMYEYIPYAIKQGKDPTDGKVLAEFLMTKGKHMAKYMGNDAVNCGLAIIDLIKSSQTATTLTKTGNVPLATLTWGLAMLDLIEVGNSCEPAQYAYYELFLKQSSVSLAPVRAKVRQSYAPMTPLR